MKDVRRILAEVPHWCTEKKAEWIYNTVRERKPITCVEIGVFGGGSFSAFAFALKENEKEGNIGTVYGIDPWCADAAMQGIGDDDAKKLDFDKIYDDFIKVFKREGFQDVGYIFRDKSEDCYWYFPVPFCDKLEIDILHIDGNHSNEAVTKDLELYLPLMRDDGIIILDDINWPTVAAAIDKFPQLKQIENFTTWGVYEIENRTNHT